MRLRDLGIEQLFLMPPALVAVRHATMACERNVTMQFGGLIRESAVSRAFNQLPRLLIRASQTGAVFRLAVRT